MLRFIRNKKKTYKCNPPSKQEAGGLDIKLVAENWTGSNLSSEDSVGSGGEGESNRGGEVEKLTKAIEEVLNFELDDGGGYNDTDKGAQEGYENTLDFDSLFAEAKARALSVNSETLSSSEHSPAETSGQTRNSPVITLIQERTSPSELLLGLVGRSDGTVVKRGCPTESLQRPSDDRLLGAIGSVSMPPDYIPQYPPPEGIRYSPAGGNEQSIPYKQNVIAIQGPDDLDYDTVTVNVQVLRPGFEDPEGPCEDNDYGDGVEQVMRSSPYDLDLAEGTRKTYPAVDYEDPGAYMVSALSDPGLSLRAYDNAYGYGYSPEGGRPYHNALPPVLMNGNLRSKRPELRVSFRDDDSVIHDKNRLSDGTLDRQTLPYLMENQMEEVADMEEKGMLDDEEKKEEDCVSVGSVASDMSESDLRPSRLLLRRTIGLGWAWLAMGLYTEVVGPNIPYLMSRVNGTYDEMSRALVSRSLGSFTGSILGGLLCEVCPNFVDLWIALSLILAAVCTAAAPWCTQILHLAAALGGTGIARGFLCVAGVSLMCRLWSKKKSTLMIFLLHLAYALGAIPTAQLAQLFESRALENILAVNLSMVESQNGGALHSNGHGVEHSTALAYNSSKTSAHSPTTPSSSSLLDLIPRPMYPFDIAAIIAFLLGAVFLVFFGSAMQSLPNMSSAAASKIQEASVPHLKPNTWFQGRALPSFRILFYVLVFFVMPLAPQTVFGGWLSHILENASYKPELERSTCLLLQTLFWAAFALGRLLAPLLFLFLTPNGLTISCVTLTLVATTILCVYAYKYVIFLWIFLCVAGTFSGPLFPAGITRCNTFISFNPMGMAVAFSLSFLGEALISWQTAFLFQHFRPDSLFYLAVCGSGLAFLFYLPVIPALSGKPLKPKRRKLKPVDTKVTKKKLQNGEIRI